MLRYNKYNHNKSMFKDTNGKGHRTIIQKRFNYRFIILGVVTITASIILVYVLKYCRLVKSKQNDQKSKQEFIENNLISVENQKSKLSIDDNVEPSIKLLKIKSKSRTRYLQSTNAKVISTLPINSSTATASSPISSLCTPLQTNPMSIQTDSIKSK